MRWRQKKIRQRYGLSTRAVRVIAWSPVVIVLAFLLVLEVPATRPFGQWMLQENRPVELLTFVALFAAGLLGLRLTALARRNGAGLPVVGFYSVFAAGLLFVAMEEISWGQWFFGFETPAAVKAVNFQGEMNFHNILSLNVAFEYLRVAFGVGGLVGTWLSYQPPTRFVVAPSILSAWFVLIALFATLDLLNYYYRYPTGWMFVAASRMVEVLEMLIGVAAFLYMWLNTRFLSREWVTTPAR